MSIQLHKHAAFHFGLMTVMLISASLLDLWYSTAYAQGPCSTGTTNPGTEAPTSSLEL